MIPVQIIEQKIILLREKLQLSRERFMELLGYDSNNSNKLFLEQVNKIGVEPLPAIVFYKRFRLIIKTIRHSRLPDGYYTTSMDVNDGIIYVHGIDSNKTYELRIKKNIIINIDKCLMKLFENSLIKKYSIVDLKKIENGNNIFENNKNNINKNSYRVEKYNINEKYNIDYKPEIKYEKSTRHLDGSKDYSWFKEIDNGQYLSHPEHDDYGEEGLV